MDAADVHNPDFVTHHFYQKADLIIFGNRLLGLDGEGHGVKERPGRIRCERQLQVNFLVVSNNYDL